jgi:hypothetical protein
MVVLRREALDSVRDRERAVDHGERVAVCLGPRRVQLPGWGYRSYYRGIFAVIEPGLNT